MGFLGNVTSAVSRGASDMFNPAGNPTIASVIPGIGDSMAAKEQNAASIAAADRAMQFSERMSSTAYQRGMDDMKKAGLNPLLAFSQGGASSPGGVTPTINSETKTKFGETALQAGLGIASTSNAKQQADTQKLATESAVKVNATSAAKNIADTERTIVETAKARKDLPRAELEEKLSRKATSAIESAIDSFTSSGKERARTPGILGTFMNGLDVITGKKSLPGVKSPTVERPTKYIKQNKFYSPQPFRRN